MVVFWFLLLITVLVFVHELGHYLVARWNGVKVDVFSIGFGSELFGFNDRAGTRWKFSAIPLGGYVKFFDDINITSASSKRVNENVSEEQSSQSFHTKTLLQKSAVLFAGPFANFLFAYLLLFLLFFLVGIPQHNKTTVVQEVMPNSVASNYGIMSGDEIIEVQDQIIKDAMQFVNIVKSSPNQFIKIVILRNGKYIDVMLKPEAFHETEESKVKGKIGVRIVEKINTSYDTASIFECLSQAFLKTYEITILILNSLKGMVLGEVSYKELGGPIRIADVSSKAAESGIENYLWIMALISINLGLINLLPIPVLDGGHLMFYFLQAVFRKPVSENFIRYASQFGMVFLIGIMVLVFYNDISYYWNDIKDFFIRK